MKRLLVALPCLAVTVACGGSRVLVPPRLALAPHRPIGLVTFSVEGARGDLGPAATNRFRDEIFAAQAGTEVFELGELDDVLDGIGRDRLDPEAARAIGEARGVSALLLGHLVVSDVRPRARLGPNPSVEAEVTVSLTARLVSTGSGGTVWSSTARARETVAGVGLIGGTPVFGARDPDEAYGQLLDRLVFAVTHDIRPTWEKR